MTYDDMLCDQCGHVMCVGDYPFCPHENGTHTVVGDDVPGGFTVENGFDQPTRFYSHSAHEKALTARGLEIRATHMGVHDRHLSRWDAPSQKTLDDARVLLSRGPTTKQDRHAELDAAKAEFPITVTTIPWS